MKRALGKLVKSGWLDWLVALIVVVLCATATPLLDHLSGAPTDAQRAAFGAEAGVFGIISGFSAAAIFGFASTDNRLARQLRRRHGHAINQTLIGSFLAVTLAAIVSAAAVLAAPSPPAGWLSLGAGLLGILKLLRIAVLAWAILETANEEARNEEL